MKLQEHLEKLRYFYEVANCKSMKKASEKVFITQPSLSKSIKLLEEVIGHELFIRLPRGVRLTNEGEELYRYCQNLFNSLSDLEKRLDFGDDPMAGSLKIGTYDSIGIYFWPHFLADFLPKYPNLSIELVTGRSSEMKELLEKGVIDIALIVNPKGNSQFVIKKMAKDRFKFYERAKGKKIYSHVDKAPLITMIDSFAPAMSNEDFLLEIGLEERKVYRTSSLESAKALCLKGLGIGFLPEFVAHELVDTKKIREVNLKVGNKGLYEHDIGMLIHKSKQKGILINQVMQEIEKSFHDQF